MPSWELTQIANEATAMGTTLWFSGEDGKKKDKLIITGQATMCFSLIKHIQRIRIAAPELKNNPDLNNVLDALIRDWDMFKARPGFMLENIFVQF